MNNLKTLEVILLISTYFLFSPLCRWYSAMPYLVFFLLSHLLLLSLAQEEWTLDFNCLSFSCGNLRNINFPFSSRRRPECGFCVVDDCNKPVQRIQLGKNQRRLYITSTSQDQTAVLFDQVFQDLLNNRSSEAFRNITPPGSPLISFEIQSHMTLFKCPSTLDNPMHMNFSHRFENFTIFYNHPDEGFLPSVPPQCSLIQLPVDKTRNSTDLFHLLTGNFTLKLRPDWQARRDCRKCRKGGGRCLIKNTRSVCSNAETTTGTESSE